MFSPTDMDTQNLQSTVADILDDFGVNEDQVESILELLFNAGFDVSQFSDEEYFLNSLGLALSENNIDGSVADDIINKAANYLENTPTEESLDNS